MCLRALEHPTRNSTGIHLPWGKAQARQTNHSMYVEVYILKCQYCRLTRLFYEWKPVLQWLNAPRYPPAYSTYLVCPGSSDKSGKGGGSTLSGVPVRRKKHITICLVTLSRNNICPLRGQCHLLTIAPWHQ